VRCGTGLGRVAGAGLARSSRTQRMCSGGSDGQSAPQQQNAGVQRVLAASRRPVERGMVTSPADDFGYHDTTFCRRRLQRCPALMGSARTAPATRNSHGNARPWGSPRSDRLRRADEDTRSPSSDGRQPQTLACRAHLPPDPVVAAPIRP